MKYRKFLFTLISFLVIYHPISCLIGHSRRFESVLCVTPSSFLSSTRLLVSSISQKETPQLDEATKSKLLVKMITKSIPAEFSILQIEEYIRTFKVPLTTPDEATGLLPLRHAVRSGRRDVLRLLLRHGASPTASDREGNLLHEVIASSRPGWRVPFLYIPMKRNHAAAPMLL
jgi:Ankyrin repeat